MTNFKELANESEGHFVVEPNDKTEIHVNLINSEITVDTYMTANHMIGYPESESYFTLVGMFGYPTIEEKFNEIIANLD